VKFGMTFIKKLEAELNNLKERSGLGLELKVVWKPRFNNELSGEVKNNIIFIYEEDEKKAIDTLQHEFLDYCVSKPIMPYKMLLNKLIQMLNDDAYRQKEEVVIGLQKLIKNNSLSF